jgi:hypothetical protein
MIGDMMRKTWLILILLVAISLFITACAPETAKFEQKPAGFFWGIWHGWIAPVSIIWHFFNHNVRVYETNNMGIWYDTGFYLAVAGGFGSLAITRRKKYRIIPESSRFGVSYPGLSLPIGYGAIVLVVELQSESADKSLVVSATG